MNTISGVLFFIAFLPYALAMVNGQMSPSPVSWAIWVSVDTLALIAMRKEKATSGQLTGCVVGGWVVTVLALFYGKPTMGLIEWVSVVGAVAGIVLWKLTGNAVTAIICAQAAVFIGSFPTFANAYANPAAEDPVAWTIWLASCIFALLAIKKWDLANALQPLSFTIIEIIMFVLVVVRPYLL